MQLGSFCAPLQYGQRLEQKVDPNWLVNRFIDRPSKHF